MIGSGHLANISSNKESQREIEKGRIASFHIYGEEKNEASVPRVNHSKKE